MSIDDHIYHKGPQNPKLPDTPRICIKERNVYGMY